MLNLNVPQPRSQLLGFKINMSISRGYFVQKEKWTTQFWPGFISCFVSHFGPAGRCPANATWQVLIFKLRTKATIQMKPARPEQRFILLQPKQELLDIYLDEFGTAPHRYGVWLRARCRSTDDDLHYVHSAFLTPTLNLS